MLDLIKHPAFLWSVLIFVVPGIILWIASYFVGSFCAYPATLRKSSKWGEEIPTDLCEESRKMYEAGAKWAEEYADKKTEMHIVRDGLNLFGEYYDLGYDKTVIILSGRTENRKYGYYFAIPYAKNGCNVVVLDPRAHGKSDGEFNTVGFEESRDLIAWIEHLSEKHGVKHVILHGICIGAAGGMLALTSEDPPSCVDAIVTEGMFANFSESVKNHLIEHTELMFMLIYP